MRLLIFLFLLVPQVSHAVCERIRHVMVTGFEPFAERKQNGSQLTVEALMKQNPEDTCVRYQACILPVEFEKGAAKAIECFEKSLPKPDIVMSMGEGGCDLRIETRGHNLNSASIPDNAGVVHEKEIIDDEGPLDSLLTLPVPAMYCASQVALGSPSSVSTTPGFYVCNDVAYRLAQYFKTQKVPFGFTHVPVADSCPGVKPAETADKITVMARAAIRNLSLTTTIFAKNIPRCKSDEAVYSSLQAEMIPLSKVITSACRQQVLRQLSVKAERFEKRRQKMKGDIPTN